MAGLLYKDFIAVKGKWYMGFALLWMALSLIIKIAVPGEETEYVLMGIAICVIFIFYAILIFKVEVSVASTDEGRKQKQYYLSLPVSTEQYVASKYIFMLIAYYAVLSMGIFVLSICLIGCQSEEVEMMLGNVQPLVPIWACILLLVSAIELPFFIAMGRKKGNRIKTGLSVALFFLVIVYMLFGDLRILDKLNMAEVLNYLENNLHILLAFETFLPCLALGGYYLSYKVSCLLLGRRKWEDD